MNKPTFESADINAQNISAIEKLFPSCITETKDKDGNLKRSVDFEKLRELLGGDIAEGDESYEFTWVGKKAAIKEAGTPVRMTLRPCKEESKNWDTTENLYIEGDNLDVLKMLQESYLGKVKMIYIDPPYNTGNDFIYNDSFEMDKDEYAEGTGAVDEDENRNFRQNNDSNPRFHSDWCSMIYPRLTLARNLLTDDGVIFISIDDNEQSNLKKICDKIFGEENFIANFTVASNSTKNNSKYVSISHEYVICFSKNIGSLDDEWMVKKNNVDEYYTRAMQLVKRDLSQEEIHNELLELTKYPRFYDLDHYTYADEKGIYQTDNPGGVTNGNTTTEITHPLTGKICAKPIGGWRYKESEIRRLEENELLAFGKDETIVPRPKRYLSDYIYQVPKSTLFFDSQSSTKWLKANKLPFNFAKSVDLIKYLLSTCSEKSNVILDFFSGSATTAHAVMQLNAEDGGNRKFIMVQLPERCDEKSEAFKAGYKNICEIGKERIRRAGDKILKEWKENSEQANLFNSKEIDTMGGVWSSSLIQKNAA